MIDTLEGILNFLYDNNTIWATELPIMGSHLSVNDKPQINTQSMVGERFCSTCGAIRKVSAKVIYPSSGEIYMDDMRAIIVKPPILLTSKCLQCSSEALLLLYNGCNGQELAVLNNSYSGAVTPHTPIGVKYYIDQAYRARSVGAASASMAMYRSALEWVLYEQGYEKGMLNKQIEKLKTDIESGSAPKWATEIDTGYLSAIKEIGNGAIHTNDGDISKQEEIDQRLLELVDIVLAEILDRIYEQPIKTKDNLDRLKAKATIFK